ncbi:MAG: HEPN domain-containing protein [Chloroflexota bacterium]|nr:HEPN domain-containing protein [Chloroflexota bacterium]MDE2684392.1 HEPN domain-containing protein [Chloroflexota bacterium]
MISDSVAEGLSAAALEAKWKSKFRWQERNPFNNRIRRALSWLARAEGERERDDLDAAFIFCWIAFNAVYADDSPETYDLREDEKFADYFSRIAELDANRDVFNAIWREHNRSIRDLLANNFVYKPFWKGIQDWRTRFDDAPNRLEDAITSKQTDTVLDLIFARLYVLRNQLLHGAATWRGETNRDQVEDGAAIMAFLLPHFINLMLDNPGKDWGHPPYSPEWAWERLGIQQKA